MAWLNAVTRLQAIFPASTYIDFCPSGSQNEYKRQRFTAGKLPNLFLETYVRISHKSDTHILNRLSQYDFSVTVEDPLLLQKFFFTVPSINRIFKQPLNPITFIRHFKIKGNILSDFFLFAETVDL